MNDIGTLERAIEGSTAEVKNVLERFSDRVFQLEQRVAEGGDYTGGSHESQSIADEIRQHSHFELFKNGGTKSIRIQLNRPLFETKATIVSSAALVRPDRRSEIKTPAERRLTVRDLLPVSPTTSGTIEWLKEASFTNTAAPTAEGAVKPESSMTFSLQTSTVKTIAHWIPASKQVLDDSVQLRSYIDRRLLYGLQLIEETQLLSGNGVGENLSGLISNATSYDVAMNQAGDTRLDKLRHAIKQLEVAEHQADGIVLHPTDWEAIELLKDSEDRYIYGDPKNGTSGTNIWSVPKVVTTAIAAGSFLVGDFQMAAEIFDRQQPVVEISFEHSDFWTRNLCAIRCENRVVLVTYKALALVTGTF